MIGNLLFSRVHIPLLCSLLLLHGCGGGGGSSNPKPQPTSTATSSTPATSSAPITSVSTTSASTTSVATSVSISSTVATSSATVTSVATSSSAPSSVASTSVPGASSSSSSSIALQTLTLSGWVGSNTLISGQVVVSAGTKNVIAQIDSQQKYQVTLELDQQQKSLPITAVVTGAGNKQWVEFATVWPSAETLAALAGNDNILTENEFAGVNITALTTAEYAEVKNKNLPLTSDIERKRALAGVHPVRAIEQAAMITRLLSDPALSLPSHKQSTLAYLLDASVAETYLETLRVASKLELIKQIKDMQDDILTVSTKSLSGHFALESQHSNYFLTLNDNGTGHLQADTINDEILSGGSIPRIKSNITWTRTGSSIVISFTTPVSYKVSGTKDVEGKWLSCDDTATSQVELCNLVFNSIQLDLVSESDVRYVSLMTINVSASKEIDGSTVYQGAIEPSMVRLTNVDTTGDVVASDLNGSEWISKYYSFVFSADGKVTQKNLLDKTIQTVNWTLTGNNLQAGNLNIWFGARNEAGFNVFWVSDDVVARDAMVKRSAVSMAEADWVGRWSYYPADINTNAYDVNADKTWRDGFEAKSKGSWARVDGHRQTSLSNAIWRMERDVLAIHNGKYYLSVCQGTEATPFSASSCYLSTEVKSADFSSKTFWNTWSYPAFNEKVSGGVWLSLWGQLISSSNPASNLFGHSFYKVSATTLYLPMKKTIVEMTAANQNEIEMCEYQLNSSCNDADKRTYATGVEVKLTANTGGEANYELTFASDFYGASPTLTREVDKIFMVPKNRAFMLRIDPDNGRTLGSISGCAGSLVGRYYNIPALTENCEIVVSFQ